MTLTPTWWRAIGGPSAISRWSGIFTVVLLVPSAVWTAAYSSLTVGWALLVEVIAAVVALLMLWFAHATWLSPHRADGGHRTLLALATFFAVGLVRLVAMFATRALLGIDQPWSPWQALFTGGIYSVVILSIVAIVVDALRGHAQTMASLRQAEESLERARQLDAAEAEQLQRSYVEQVLATVRDGIARLSAGQDSDSLAKGLRLMAERIVRESSHSLSEGRVVAEAVAVPLPRARLVEAFRQMRPAAPVLGPVGFEALVFTAVLRDLGSAIAVLNATVATVVLMVGNVVLCAIAQRHWPVRGRVLTLAVAYVVIGLVAVMSVSLLVSWVHGATPALWVGAISYAVFMLFFSAISSLSRGQVELEDALAASVAAQAEELARVRALVAEQRARLAHLMHGGLQAELTAAALTLSSLSESVSAGTDRSQVVADLLLQIDRHEGLVDGQQIIPEVDDIVDTWKMALELAVSHGASVREALEREPELRLRVVDVLSEALTNVVRHGAERRAEILIAHDDQGRITLRVSNPGTLTEGNVGLGSQQMDEKCVEWSRSQEGELVVVHALLVARELAGHPAA